MGSDSEEQLQYKKQTGTVCMQAYDSAGWKQDGKGV